MKSIYGAYIFFIIIVKNIVLLKSVNGGYIYYWFIIIFNHCVTNRKVYNDTIY
jgi:hypothetical protein